MTINKAILTVFANDESRKYGQQNPEFTVIITGFVNDENESVLTALPTASCAANASSEVGIYDITVSGGAADNYKFIYTKGTLTVIADTTELIRAIEEAEKLNENDYTEKSWKTLQSAIKRANDTLNKDGVTPIEINTATVELNYAIDVLIHLYEFDAKFDIFKGSGSISGTVNAPSDKFVRLLIDGEKVDSSNYTIADGSTVITLSEAYLKILKDGNYTITAVFTDGSAITTLNVDVDKSCISADTGSTGGTGSSAKRTAPSTGDSTDYTLIILMAASLSVLFIYRKKPR